MLCGYSDRYTSQHRSRREVGPLRPHLSAGLRFLNPFAGECLAEFQIIACSVPDFAAAAAIKDGIGQRLGISNDSYWKGNPHVSRQRADLMKCNVTAQNDWNASLYAQAALINTAIPKVQVAANASSDEQPEFDVSDEEFLQFSKPGVPVLITLTKVGRHYIVDATTEEESQYTQLSFYWVCHQRRWHCPYRRPLAVARL